MSQGPQTYLCNRCSKVHNVGSLCGEENKLRTGLNTLFEPQFITINPEPSMLVSISLIMDIYAEIHKTRPDLAEKIQKIVKGEE